MDAPVSRCRPSPDSLLHGQQWSAERADAWYAGRPWIAGANYLPAERGQRAGDVAGGDLRSGPDRPRDGPCRKAWASPRCGRSSTTWPGRRTRRASSAAWTATSTIASRHGDLHDVRSLRFRLESPASSRAPARPRAGAAQLGVGAVTGQLRPFPRLRVPAPGILREADHPAVRAGPACPGLGHHERAGQHQRRLLQEHGASGQDDLRLPPAGHRIRVGARDRSRPAHHRRGLAQRVGPGHAPAGFRALPAHLLRHHHLPQLRAAGAGGPADREPAAGSAGRSSAPSTWRGPGDPRSRPSCRS